MTKNLLETLLNKIRNAPYYRLQLDESTNFGSRAQLLVYIRIPGIDLFAVVEEYLCCLDLSVSATAEQLFAKCSELTKEK